MTRTDLGLPIAFVIQQLIRLLLHPVFEAILGQMQVHNGRRHLKRHPLLERPPLNLLLVLKDTRSSMQQKQRMVGRTTRALKLEPRHMRRGKICEDNTAQQTRAAHQRQTQVGRKEGRRQRFHRESLPSTQVTRAVHKIMAHRRNLELAKTITDKEKRPAPVLEGVIA
jgi:hypothetical protein